MKKKEVIKDCIEALNNGADMTEVVDYIEQYTDYNPTEIVDEIYKKEVLR
jgi:hypothetical protein